jgi:hypothetical protein
MAGSIILLGKMSVGCCYGAAVWPFTVPTCLISAQGINIHFASGKFSSLASIYFLCISLWTVLDINILKSCMYHRAFLVLLGDVLTGKLICQRDKMNVRALNVTIFLLTRKLRYVIRQ